MVHDVSRLIGIYVRRFYVHVFIWSLCPSAQRRNSIHLMSETQLESLQGVIKLWSMDSVPRAIRVFAMGLHLCVYTLGCPPSLLSLGNIASCRLCLCLATLQEETDLWRRHPHKGKSSPPASPSQHSQLCRWDPEWVLQLIQKEKGGNGMERQKGKTQTQSPFYIKAPAAVALGLHLASTFPEPQ